MYDFVGGGAGPPESRFDRRAAEANHDVLALEKGKVGKRGGEIVVQGDVVRLSQRPVGPGSCCR